MDDHHLPTIIGQTNSRGEANEVTLVPVVSNYGAAIAIRLGTDDDIPWMDTLQKANNRAVGFLRYAILKGKIKLGQVLVATMGPRRVGYIIAADRYNRRDELGMITQVNVEPEFRRHLVAGQLLQAQFDRSAHGVKLYCCWCAQDLEKASAFWQAMGFVPIAFRVGSYTKGEGPDGKPGPRVHILWQKRIRAGDDRTPYWYPAKTEGGALRADRIVFPIPPGVHWKDVEPIVLPEIDAVETKAISHSKGSGVVAGDEPGDSETDCDATTPDPVADVQQREKVAWPKGVTEEDGTLYRDGKRLMTKAMILAEQNTTQHGMWHVPADAIMVEALPEPKVKRAKKTRKRAAKKTPAKTVDPRLVALSRELRDRWLDEVEHRPNLIAHADARHDVRRLVKAASPLSIEAASLKALPKAA